MTTNNLSNNLSIVLSTGTGSFSAATTFTMLGKPTDVKSFDFNNDGNKDIAVGANVSSSIAIFFGNGSGGFSVPTYYLTSSGIGMQSLLIKDFNGDGIQDITISHHTNTSNTISYLPGTGSGVFGTAFNIAACPKVYGITASDFNKDGKQDLVVANWTDLSVSVLFNLAPTLTLSATSATICAGNSITLSATGASTYSWSNGVSNGVAFTPTATGVYTVTANNSCGYTQATSTVNLITVPNLTATVSSSTVCYGTSVSFNAIGATTYTWNNGIVNGVSFIPTITDTYTVYGTNICGTSSETISVGVNNTCQDVWPGDANSDGTADNLDILELGLHYTQTGTSRASTSSVWQSYFSTNWTGTITNGKNLNHSDCNGDGTINDNDTLAIYNNYGLIHAFKTAHTNTVNPQLSIIPDQASIIKGNWGTASIYLGDVTTNINNINGVAFTVDFDNTLIETNNIWIEYLPSFIDASQNLHFRKLDFANGKIFTASTHTVSTNVNGFGKIATLHYQIKSSLTTDQVLNIGISQANQSDATGGITPLTSGAGTLMAIGASVGLQELTGNIISISPNPTNGLLTINSQTELQKVEIISVDGKVLLSETPTNASHTLHLGNLSNGIYFVNLYQDNRIVKREKIVLNK